jgi:hypothetical protein
MPEALADLIQTANSKSLTEKVKKAAKMAGFSRLFSPMSSTNRS